MQVCNSIVPVPGVHDLLPSPDYCHFCSKACSTRVNLVKWKGLLARLVKQSLQVGRRPHERGRVQGRQEDGRGTLKFADGSVQSGTWKDDKFLG